MTKNPILNSLFALAYIVIVVTLLDQAFSGGPAGIDHSILAPIAMLSLFTLSAAVMGYIFISEPFKLYFDGKKKEGIKLFLHTVLSFAVVTIIAFFIAIRIG